MTTEKLIDGYLVESLTDDEVEELSRRLEESAEARVEFREAVKLHGVLSEHFTVIEDLSPWATVDRASTGKAWWMTPVAAAAASIVVGGLSLLFRTSADETLATVTHEVKAEWEGRMAGLKFGRGLYTLADGLAVLRVGQGVELAIEGPARFEFLSPKRMRLDWGRVAAQVEEAGQGFVVLWFVALLVDLERLQFALPEFVLLELYLRVLC